MLRLEVWPGGKLGLDKMKVPLNAEVKSGGEIEKFMTEHKAKRQGAKVLPRQGPL